LIVSAKAFEFVTVGSIFVATLAASAGNERLSLVAQLTTVASLMMALLTAEEAKRLRKAK